ncbi:hypothetical protein [Metallibacterium scheffleri]|jgi:hypothetical protein|uniref:hypothetical protein n=1 Tax=Metallibacterium scheffleri TaxID=993689 RepID=UPI0026F0D820|nr:hypothetical protein [Metallibacterium scheffleri]MBW8076383.1 hypothetical protein [Metallibacterium scheffleri]
MLRNIVLLSSLMVVVIGASGPRMWAGVAAWVVCAAILQTSRDTTTASIGAWSAAVVALLVMS